MRHLAYPCLAATVFILGWESAVRLLSIPRYVLPTPSQTFVYLTGDFDVLLMLGHATLKTATAAGLGFLLAALIGVVSGAMLARFSVLRLGVYPLANLLQMVPIIALAPLLNIWFGYGLTGVAASACIVAIFPVIANTVDGLRSVDPKLVELFHLYRSSRYDRWAKLDFPAALPQIFTGLRIAAGLSVIGAVVGELVSGILDEPPIGALIASGLRNSELELVFSAILMSAIVGFALFGLVSWTSATLIGPWHSSARETVADESVPPSERRVVWAILTSLLLLTAVSVFISTETVRPPTNMGDGQSAKAGPKSRTVRLQLNWVPEPEFGGIYAAQDFGYFREEGLTVEIVKGGPGVAAPQLVSTGAVEFAVVSGDQLVTLRAKGAPLVGIYACFDTFPRGIMVHEENAPSSLESLWRSDRVVAVEPGHAFAKWLNHVYGGQSLRMVPSQGGLAQFKQSPGLAQAVFIFAEPVTLSLERVPTRIFAVSDSGYNPYSVLIATNEQFLREHPIIVAKMFRAIRRGWRRYLADTTITNRTMSALNPAMSFEAMEAAAKLAEPYILGRLSADQHGKMSVVRWRTLIQQLETIGVVTDDVQAEDCFWSPE